TLVESLLEPNLSGDAPGRALIPVLVVAHEQQIIGDLGVGSITAVIVVERHSEHNGKAALGESLRHFCKKGLKVLLRPRRDFLEVNGQSLKLIRLEKRDDLIQPRRSRCRIGKPPRQTRPAPHPAPPT